MLFHQQRLSEFLKTFRPEILEWVVHSGSYRGDVRPKADCDDAASNTSAIVHLQSVSGQDPYLRPAVKIEAGAKSALDPNEQVTVEPYVADDVPAIPLSVAGVTAVAAERSFWDKVINRTWSAPVV